MLEQIVLELQRRSNRAQVSFIDENFAKQKEILLDNSRFQAWLCTRRGGKSTTFAKKALARLVNNSGHKGLFLALTLDSAKSILWDIVESELDQKKIKYTPYKQQGIFQLENKSQLRFFGVDSSYKEMRKILGQKLSIVGIDEAGSMTIDMENLIYQMISPALVDLSGDLVLLGTAENIPNTFHEKVTRGLVAGWSVHKWTTFDNPYQRDNWKREIERLKRDNPNIEKASWFRTHYLNEWCTDDDLKIYFLTENNFFESSNEYEFKAVGVDLGFNDATAFVLVGYNRNSPKLSVIESHKFTEMDFTDVAKFLRQMIDVHDPFKIVIDGANKQGVEELKRRWGIPLQSAEKTDKSSYIRIMSDEIKTQKIMINKNKNNELVKEMSELMWLKGTDREDPRCQNHLCDALLYVWREMKNYINQEKETVCKTANERMLEMFLEEEKKMMEEISENSLSF